MSGAAVKAGYKRTEVGVIPEEWDSNPLESVASVTSGKRLPLGKSLTEKETPHPYIRVTDMRPGTVSLSDIKFVPLDVFQSIKRYRIFKEDIFISVAGTLGIVGKIPAQLNGSNLTENADRITNITCSQDYLLYVLMSPVIQNTIDSLQTVGAQPKLALTRIRKFAIPLPPTRLEQDAIAAVLTDMDALISGLDQLIAKKRDLKQAAMQQLLTGQRRLPGFSGAWETKRLGDLGIFFKGKGIKKDKAQSEGIPCIRYGEIYTRYNDYARLLSTFISSEVASQSQKIYKGDLAFAGSGETSEEIGKCVAYLGDGEAYAGGDTVILRPDSQNSMFLGFYLNTPIIATQKSRLGQGDAVVHISASHLAQIKIYLPEKPEQDAIAAVLSDMDAELSALELRRDKTRALKQGMMQELLTGRIRLV